jgi:hypothetical protein
MFPHCKLHKFTWTSLWLTLKLTTF